MKVAEGESHPEAYDPDDWRVVVPGDIYVYSAHLDPWLEESLSTIRILGTMRDALYTNLDLRPKLWCRVWEMDSVSLEVDSGSYQTGSGSHKADSGSRVEVHEAEVIVRETQDYWNKT